MSRGKSFSDFTLPPRMPWPAKGYKLFQVRSPMRTGKIGGNELVRISVMIAAYKRAGDTLVQELINNTGIKNSLVYPILYCYRHFIELSLKSTLWQHEASSGVAPIWNKHDLVEIWDKLTQALDINGIPNDEVRQTVDAQIREFNEFDKIGDKARFNVDTKGNLITLSVEEVDVGHLELGIAGLDAYFHYLIEMVPEEI